MQDENQTTERSDSAVNQGIRRRLVEREVLTNVSLLVSETAGQDEDFFHLFRRDDWEEPASDAGWEWDEERDEFVNRESPEETYEDDDGTENWQGLCEEWDIANDGDDAQAEAEAEGWEWDEERQRFCRPETYGFAYQIGDPCDEHWQELCESQGIDPHEHEALEHWAVSEWFADKLEAEGEIVGDFHGLRVWGRCCSGQAILLDGVVGTIASDMGILIGQPNSWEEPGEDVIQERVFAAAHKLAKALKVGCATHAQTVNNKITINGQHMSVEKFRSLVAGL